MESGKPETEGMHLLSNDTPCDIFPLSKLFSFEETLEDLSDQKVLRALEGKLLAVNRAT